MGTSSLFDGFDAHGVNEVLNVGRPSVIQGADVNGQPAAQATAQDFRDAVSAALEGDDWHTAYLYAKGWVGSGGGAWSPDAWLAYAASAILHGQPRIAVHSLDLALGNWVTPAADRAVLRWARGALVLHALNDPKTAVLDLEAATGSAPDWLRDRLATDLATCREEAPRSRKRKPSVDPAPELAARPVAHDVVAAPDPLHEPGARPGLWEVVLPLLTRRRE